MYLAPSLTFILLYSGDFNKNVLSSDLATRRFQLTKNII